MAGHSVSLPHGVASSPVLLRGESVVRQSTSEAAETNTMPTTDTSAATLSTTAIIGGFAAANAIFIAVVAVVIIILFSKRHCSASFGVAAKRYGNY